MNKYDFVKCIAEKSSTTHKQAETFLDSLQSTIKEQLSKGESISLKGFGTFKKLEKKARVGRNPKTGEEVKIAAKSVAKLTFSKEFTV